MRLKSCKHCGRVFDPATTSTYLCPECHNASKAAGVVRPRTCRQCGVSFPGGPRAWYCSSCRADRRRVQDRMAKRNGAVRPIGSTDLCVRCGKEYIVASGRQKYCPDCAAGAVNETVKAHKREYAAERKDQMLEYKTTMRRDRHVCIVCGKIFDSDLPVATCSEVCDKIRRQQNQKKADSRRSPRRKSDE